MLYYSFIVMFMIYFHSTIVNKYVGVVTGWNTGKGLVVFRTRLPFLLIRQTLNWLLWVVINPGSVTQLLNVITFELFLLSH